MNMNIQLYNLQVADDSSLQLKKYGEYLFDHIIVFAPTVEEFGGTLNAEVRSKYHRIWFDLLSKTDYKSSILDYTCMALNLFWLTSSQADVLIDIGTRLLKYIHL